MDENVDSLSELSIDSIDSDDLEELGDLNLPSAAEVELYHNPAGFVHI